MLDYKQIIHNRLSRVTHYKGTIVVLILSILYYGTIALYYSSRIDTTCMNPYPEARSYDTFYYLTLINNNGMDFWLIRHPLIVQFYKSYGSLLSFLGANVNLLSYIIVSCVLLSCSNALIYIILRKNIVSVRVAMVMLFSSFSHTILLSTQIESFPITCFSSILTVYIVTSKRVNVIWDNLLFAVMTGATSTNAVKFILMKVVVAIKEKWGGQKFVVNISKSVILFCILWSYPLYILLNKLYYNGLSMDLILSDTMKYVTAMDDRLLMFMNGFVCDSICFHPDNIAYNNPHGDLGSYDNIFMYIPILIIYSLAIYGGIKYFRHIVVRLLLCCFFTDLFFNQIVGYGVNQSWIVCGGWLFVIPILIGYAINGIKNQRLRKLFVYLFCSLSIFLATHNIYLFVESLSHPNPYTC